MTLIYQIFIFDLSVSMGGLANFGCKLNGLITSSLFKKFKMNKQTIFDSHLTRFSSHMTRNFGFLKRLELSTLNLITARFIQNMLMVPELIELLTVEFKSMTHLFYVIGLSELS